MENQCTQETASDTEIILVDDDPMALMICEMYMRRSEITTTIRKYANGQTAYEYLSHAALPGRCLVLLDINMPVMNGWEFLDAITRNDTLRTVDVVIVSSSTDEADKQRAAAYRHVRHYVEKPVNAETIEQLKQYLA